MGTSITRASAHIDDRATLPVAYRAYIQPRPPRPPTHKPPLALPWPQNVLVFDTETSVDARQQLVFGSWRYGHWGAGEFISLEEGLIYADELPTVDPDGWHCLQEYVATRPADTQNRRRRKLLLLPQRGFVNDRLWKALQAGALIVGYNLPFDMTRLAIGCGKARGLFDGGFSMLLFDRELEPGVRGEHSFRPRFRFKALDSKRALMGISKPYDATAEQKKDLARFLDLKALVFGLTGEHLSLNRAAARFGLSAQKLAAKHEGRVTAAYIDYNRQDVALTVQLLEAVRDEWDSHPVRLSPDKVMSPAGLAKGYLRAMGVMPPARKFANVPPEALGAAMSAYFGGRSEVRIRRTPVPVVYMDFLSMYPTVNTLMRLWRILVAQDVQMMDATAQVRRWQQTVTFDQCFNPEIWAELAVFVKVKADGHIVPVRAHYDPAAQHTSIGVNPLTSAEPIWLTGPDLVASWLLTGRWPEVIEAFQLAPIGVQDGLVPVALRGHVAVHPQDDDFFRRVIEARHQVRSQANLGSEERERLNRFLKVLANSGSYGIYAEFNVTTPQRPDGDPVTVYGRAGNFAARTTAPEDPGEFCFPPLAALITGGARLMLALLERCVMDAGGVIAFGDTDSAAIVALPEGGPVPCIGGPVRLTNGREAVRALTWRDVGTIRDRFASLNPYDPIHVPGSILKTEAVNYDGAGAQRTVWAFAISAKRYALYSHDSEGGMVVLSAKEHGLGHLRNPMDLDSEDRDWIAQVWACLVREACGEPLQWPAWASRPAVSRVSVSTTQLYDTFATLNKGKCYSDQIKPANFGLSVTVAPLGYPIEIDPTRFHLLAPYEDNPAKWSSMEWYDLYSGATYRIGIGRDTPATHIQVRSYRDVFDEYRVHPEPKSLGAEGAPCHRATVGLLQRRPVVEGDAIYIGKESNAIEAVYLGLVHSIADVRQAHTTPGVPPWVHAMSGLAHLSVKQLARIARCSERMIKYLRAGQRKPSAVTARRLIRAAQQWAAHTG